jgi:glycosyltransferase involved in cell wall biosynthesis
MFQSIPVRVAARATFRFFNVLSLGVLSALVGKFLTQRRRLARRLTRQLRRHLRRQQLTNKRHLGATIRHMRELQQAGDLHGALAVCDRIPRQLREHPLILQERGDILQRLGRLNDALEAYTKVLALDPAAVEAWQNAGFILRDLGRKDELPTFLENMLGALPRAPETLMLAVQISSRARLHDLADNLLEQALCPAANPTGAALLEAAQILLQRGEHGRVVHILQRESVINDAEFRDQAVELRALALSGLRLAGWSNVAGPIEESDRADIIAVQSLLEQRPDAQVRKPGQGIVIVSNSLLPGGITMQTARLVRQLRSAPRGVVGPITLLLMSRSMSAQKAGGSNLADPGVTVESIADVDIDITEMVSKNTANRLSVLPPKISIRTAFLVDRLRNHKPEVVLAMGETNGIAAILAASIVPGPKVVVSGRADPPPARGIRDTLIKSTYQMALAAQKVAIVTNSAATARQFKEWLERPSAPIGTIYNGIDVDELLSGRNATATAAHRRSLGIREHARIVGTVFNARKEKRPGLWIAAAAVIARRAPDVVFVVVGGGRMPSDVSTTVKQFGLQNRFHMPGVQRDIATWLELMDVVLLTSESEGTPNVLLEAQALGRPVVATAVGGSAETFLPEQTGVLVSANPTPDEIADAVMRVLDDSGFARRAREQAPAFIRERFSERRMGLAFLNICFGNVTAEDA